MFLAQHQECLPHRQAVHDSILATTGRLIPCLYRLDLGLDVHHPLAAPQAVDPLVAHDAKHPHPESLHLGRHIAGRDGAHHAVLKQVFSAGGVTGQGKGIAIKIGPELPQCDAVIFG